jgi:hypothetical protein
MESTPLVAHIRVSQMRKLDFVRITFAIQPTLLLSYVDVAGLSTLVLRRCHGLGLFLPALALAFSHACSLKELEISMPVRVKPSEVTIQPYEALLNSVSGLQKLWIDVARGRLVDISCVTRHGSTLRQLGLCRSPEAARTQTHIDAADLRTLLAVTPNLQSLAINLCPIDLGDLHRFGSNFTLKYSVGSIYVPGELESSLDALADHPKPRSLHVLSISGIDFGESHEHETSQPKDDQVLATQVIMQKFSTEVVRYLAKQGSLVDTFGIASDRCSNNRSERDDNGHQWPRYFYRRGRTIDARGVDRIVAVPAKIFQDRPEYTVFNWRFFDASGPE